MVKVKAGAERVTLKMPASLPLLEGDEASLEFILRVTDLVDDESVPEHVAQVEIPNIN